MLSISQTPIHRHKRCTRWSFKKSEKLRGLYSRGQPARPSWKENFSTRSGAATGQAFLIVALVAVASGIGSLDEGGIGGLRAVPTGIVLNLVGWVVWASLSYLIGTKLLATPSTDANWSHLARTLGFAQSPGILRVLGIIPGLGISIGIVTIVWQSIAMVVGGLGGTSSGWD